MRSDSSCSHTMMEWDFVEHGILSIHEKNVKKWQCMRLVQMISLTILAVVGILFSRRPDGKEELVSVTNRVKLLEAGELFSSGHDETMTALNLRHVDNNNNMTSLKLRVVANMTSSNFTGDNIGNKTSSNVRHAGNITSPNFGHVENITSLNFVTSSLLQSKSCCYWTNVDLYQKLTPEYFEDLRTRYRNPKNPWTSNEYEDWLFIWNQKINPRNESQESLDCKSMYSLVVLDQVFPQNLREVLNEMKEGQVRSYPLAENAGDLPRVLMLGDSITRDIVLQMKSVNNNSIASIQGAPTNCAGFDRYKSGLDHWLGLCAWDVVQFNVGMHFKPKRGNSWQMTYREGLLSIVQSIRDHSPSARVILALTTPSPFDSNATWPQRETCPHYGLFHKPGLVAAMNEVAISVAHEYGLVINDRYSAVLPVLESYQLPCNIHYTTEGSQYLAMHDFEIISGLIQGRIE